MKVVDSKLMKNYARMAMDGFNQNWHERNGGNLSYRMKSEEVEELKDDFSYEGEWRVIGWQQGDESAFPGLAGEYFMVSGSGKYFRNIELDPPVNVCIIELNEQGDRYRIVWGLTEGGMPTSELPTHLANLEVLKARDPEIRVVYHCHPANIIALTFVLPLDGKVFTREIFEMITECAVVFPKGIGIVPWVVCGGRQIGEMTAEIMKNQDVAVWAHHGAFCCGKDFDLAFGLMHTVEKAAEILVKVMSISPYKMNTITPEMFRELNEPFGIEISEEYLYEKKGSKIGQLPDGKAASEQTIRQLKESAEGAVQQLKETAENVFTQLLQSTKTNESGKAKTGEAVEIKIDGPDEAAAPEDFQEVPADSDKNG